MRAGDSEESGAKYVIRPGVPLQELMDEYHLSSRSLSAMSLIAVNDIEGILIGGVRISVTTAQRLERTFGPSMTFWLALEQRYRDGLARGMKEL